MVRSCIFFYKIQEYNDSRVVSFYEKFVDRIELYIIVFKELKKTSKSKFISCFYCELAKY